MTIRTLVSRAIVVAAIAALVAAPVTASAAQEQAAVTGAEPTPLPRFDATPGAANLCLDEPPFDQRVSPTFAPGYDPQTSPPGGASWQTSAPRSQQRVTRPGDTVELSLRDKFGTGNRVVLADVYYPDGQRYRSGRWLNGSDWADLSYPTGFVTPDGFSAPPLVGGNYTVIWSDMNSGGYIACDGFSVAS